MLILGGDCFAKELDIDNGRLQCLETLFMLRESPYYLGQLKYVKMKTLNGLIS
ncbi:protein of unknown function [Petrocella atlantisensis]|uniref:Uncharacterized protein n=1 Tax=Petrocella atlantisensis TaxID=2173034 RepID=A0A3P7PJP1_9FIRM|nr:protein of unknown function [Petrocella atlantisensis]